jgi:enterochelin esterase-like enzyme
VNLTLFLRPVAAALILTFSAIAYAQPAPPARPPAFASPEILADGKIAFRIYAPKAESVRVTGGDIPGLGQAGQMTKAENGVWELVFGPVPPGAYRYTFNVDGATVLDHRNTGLSESNNNVWSLAYVPGAEFMDTRDVPHGSLASVPYYSKTLKRFRRLHVYTPPGYETSNQKYPIFYLLHGASDSDHSWSSVGRASFILDNLIAGRKAKPMIVVMPAGHTNTPRPAGAPAGPPAPGRPMFADDFLQDFTNDIMPFVESRYRVQADRAHRAIAGLSMGGGHTLFIGIPNLEKFGYIGVYSSGLLGVIPINRRAPGSAPAPTPAPAAPAGPTWEEQHAGKLNDAQLKKGLKLFWFATGSQDFLVENTRATVELFKKHGFNPVYRETDGGHTWNKWRDYLNEFAPQLFQ